MKKVKKFIVFGHKEHGKDTACEFLRDSMGLNFISSSEFACDLFMFDLMKGQYGYETKQACHADRKNHRKYWYDQIKFFNNEDRSRLGRLIFESYDVYCGIRDLEEFQSLKKNGLFDLAIWIDASKRKPAESYDSMKLNESHADIIIDNNGSLGELYSKLDRLFKLIKY